MPNYSEEEYENAVTRFGSAKIEKKIELYHIKPYKTVYMYISKSNKTMTEKKIPTAQQMKEYRLLRKTMTTADEYEKVMVFEEEYDIFTQVFSENGKTGVKDAAGEVLVPAVYDEIGCTFADFCRGFAVPVMKGGKMALACPDGKGTLLTEAVYDHIIFDDCFYVLVKDGKYGFAMIGYGLMTEPLYENYDIESGTEYLQVVKDGVNGYIDESGEFTTEEDERFFHASCD